MEDTLRVVLYRCNYVEKSLNPCFNGRYSQSVVVVLFMILNTRLNPCFNGRYSQRALWYREPDTDYCLNPCFNGRYSQRGTITLYIGDEQPSLNPCFNGRYSQRCSMIAKTSLLTVLILVLMEDTLRALQLT